MSKPLIHFIVYDFSSLFLNAFKQHLKNHRQESEYIINNFKISIVPPPFPDLDRSFAHVVDNFKVNAIVSPGNSFGFLEGGFDLAISKYYANSLNLVIPSNTPKLLPKHISAAFRNTIIEKEHGYITPTNAVYFSSTFLQKINGLEQVSLSFSNLPDLIHVPTMTFPSELPSHTNEMFLGDSIVFNCTWNLLKCVENSLSKTINQNEFRVLLSGLGTGYGAIPPELSAFHMYQAFSMNNAESNADFIHALAGSSAWAIRE